MADGKTEPERSEEGDGYTIRVNRILNSQFQHSTFARQQLIGCSSTVRFPKSLSGKISLPAHGLLAARSSSVNPG